MFYSVTKLIWQVNGKQPQDYEDYISANSIYEKYHKINEITENDFKVWEKVPVRLSGHEFVSLLGNNFADINGSMCEILKIEFVDEESKALISFKERKLYATGKCNILRID